MSSPKRLFLIDGMALIYRSHFALIKNPLMTSKGSHTSAIFGFMNSLFKLLKDENPDYIAIVLDSKEPTFRHKLFTDYKATREKMPDELVEQLSPLFQIIEHTNIPMIKFPGFEADDIMATVAQKAKEINVQTYIVTSDKDMMQIVDDDIFIYSPGNRFKPTTIYNRKKVLEKWGVGPEKMIDYLAMVGDSSDNVPGVDGVGAKTAVKLLNKYSSLENSLENADKVKNKRAREGLVKAKDLAYLSKELVTIKLDVPIDMHFESMARSAMDIDSLNKVFIDLELNSLITSLSHFEVIETKSIDIIDKKYEIIQDLNSLKLLIDKLSTAEFVSFDLETTNIQPLLADIVGISFSVSPKSGWYIPVIYPEKDENLFDDFSIDIILGELKKIFNDSNVKFCGQNLKYDALVLSNYNVSISNIYFDSMIAEHLLNPSKNSYKLDHLAIDYLGYNMVPIERLIGKGKHQKSMADVPLSDISSYAIEDADIALQICIKQMKLLKENKLLDYFYNIEMPLLKVLMRIELNGVFVDVNYLSSLSKKVKDEIDLLVSNIYSYSQNEFNINSPQQLAVVLFDELGLKEIRKRSTAIEVLEVLKNQHPLPQLVLQYRHLAKLKNTYIDAIPQYISSKTNRVHTSLNQTVASTGRLSSTKPNFQNIPIKTNLGREIRKAFCAQDKNQFVILSADYSQIELRIIADFSDELRLISAFKNDEDIHARTAALVFDIDESQVKKHHRRMAKVVNYGIMYGAGPFRISQELGISIAESKKLIDDYFSTYPGIKKYIDDTIKSAYLKGFVTTLKGRRRKCRFGVNKIVDKAEERASINMPIQGTAAELIKIAMINLQNRLDSDKIAAKMILQVHDELLFEVHKDEVDVVAPIIVKEMETAIKINVPIIVDWNYGSDWYEAH